MRWQGAASAPVAVTFTEPELTDSDPSESDWSVAIPAGDSEFPALAEDRRVDVSATITDATDANDATVLDVSVDLPR